MAVTLVDDEVVVITSLKSLQLSQYARVITSIFITPRTILTCTPQSTLLSSLRTGSRRMLREETVLASPAGVKLALHQKRNACGGLPCSHNNALYNRPLFTLHQPSLCGIIARSSCVLPFRRSTGHLCTGIFRIAFPLSGLDGPASTSVRECELCWPILKYQFFSSPGGFSAIWKYYDSNVRSSVFLSTQHFLPTLRFSKSELVSSKK